MKRTPTKVPISLGRKPTTRIARLTARLNARHLIPWWEPRLVPDGGGGWRHSRNQAGSELRSTHSRAKRDPKLHARRRRLNARKRQVALRSATCYAQGRSSLEKGRR